MPIRTAFSSANPLFAPLELLGGPRPRNHRSPLPIVKREVPFAAVPCSTKKKRGTEAAAAAGGSPGSCNRRPRSLPWDKQRNLASIMEVSQRYMTQLVHLLVRVPLSRYCSSGVFYLSHTFPSAVLLPITLGDNACTIFYGVEHTPQGSMQHPPLYNTPVRGHHTL